MRIDTGQQMDIVYTTKSLLIVTPKDGYTSMVITKIDDELPCLKYPNTTNDSLMNQYLTLTSNEWFTQNGSESSDHECLYSNCASSLQKPLQYFIWKNNHFMVFSETLIIISGVY